MRVIFKNSPNSPRCAVQIVKAQRINGEPRQTIIRHLGVAQNQQHAKQLEDIGHVIIAHLETKKIAKKQKNDPQASLFDMLDPKEKTRNLLHIKKQILAAQSKTKKSNKTLKVDLKKIREEKRVTTGVHDIFGNVYEQLGLDKLLPKSAPISARVSLFHCVMARIAQPESKRATVRDLEQKFGYKISLASVYRAMDRIDDTFIKNLQDKAAEAAQGLLGGPVNALFFDCTTLYFESFKEDGLKQPGYSKDAKFKESQVLLALMATEEGLPVAFEVLPGASFEGKSLLPVIERMKTKFDLKKTVCVADRGMLNRTNIKALEKAGVQYIMGAKLKQLSKDKKDFILSQKKKLMSGGPRYINLKHENAKIIVTYSHQRALKEQNDREKMIRKLKKKINLNKSPKSLMGNHGSSKFLKLKGKSSVVIDEARIAKDALWDGLHGVITSVSDMSPEQIFSHKSGLWQIEETFRVTKHDLQIRPIYHWTPRRIHAHITIAFMSLLCVRHLEYRVKMQFQKMSPKAIIRCLSEVQHSVVEHMHTKKRYSIPSKISHEARKIYRLMGLQHSLEPSQLN